MKTWYTAVCDKHGEAMECSVNGSTSAYLERDIPDSKYNEADLRRQRFDRHFACELRGGETISGVCSMRAGGSRSVKYLGNG